MRALDRVLERTAASHEIGEPLNKPLGAGRSSIVVFVFTRTDCPISNRYAPELRRLHDRFREDVDFWVVYPDSDETIESIRSHLDEYSYDMPALRDPDHDLVRLTEATITPEAAVFVRGRGMVYRGRIDDRYVDFGRARREPTRRDLEETLEAALAGDPGELRTTTAVGCYLEDLR